MSEDLYAPWRDDAACDAITQAKPYMGTAWVKEDHPYSEDAKRICLGCDVRLKCLQAALDNPEADGLRGGYWFENGRLPVAVAREIRDTLPVVISSRQSLGRPKK